MPVALQNLGISLYGLAWRRERLGGNFESHVAAFRERDRWSPDQMADYVNGQLQRVLCRAFDTVPYYQDSWKRSGLIRRDLERMTPSCLSRLPVTPKDALRSNPKALLAQDADRRSRIRRYSSSGSTGTPVTVFCAPEDHRRFIAAREARSFGWAGASIHQPRAMIGGRLVVPRGVARPPFYRYNWAEQQVYFSAYHISPAHAADYAEGFNRYRPALLTGYANSYFLLARMMQAQKLRLDYQPAGLVLGSEKLTAEMKQLLQETFRARAYEEYGAVENCALATECAQGRLHVSPDFGIVEIVDDQDLPVAPGREGRILCTGLLNDTQPLIRYEIGDLGVWDTEPCPCGRDHLPVLREIVGRLEDVVVGPDGRQLVRFHGIFIDLPGVLEGQVIQETVDEFTVRIVPQGKWDNAAKKLIRQRFAERLGPVKVTIEKVAEIPRTARGKFRAVISKVKARPIK